MYFNVIEFEKKNKNNKFFNIFFLNRNNAGQCTLNGKVFTTCVPIFDLDFDLISYRRFP